MYDESGKITFNCQHGPDECYGNALHACAIDILKSPIDYVNFNSCLMKGGSTDAAADEVFPRKNLFYHYEVKKNYNINATNKVCRNE